MHKVPNDRRIYILRINLTNYATYYAFSVEPESEYYKLRLDIYNRNSTLCEYIILYHAKIDNEEPIMDRRVSLNNFQTLNQRL